MNDVLCIQIKHKNTLTLEFKNIKLLKHTIIKSNTLHTFDTHMVSSAREPKNKLIREAPATTPIHNPPVRTTADVSASRKVEHQQNTEPSAIILRFSILTIYLRLSFCCLILGCADNGRQQSGDYAVQRCA